MKFLTVATNNNVVMFLWAPQPFFKFMLFKAFPVQFLPTKVHLSVNNDENLHLAFGSSAGFHHIDVASSAVLNLFIPLKHSCAVRPLAIIRLPNTDDGDGDLLLIHDDFAVTVDRFGDVVEDVRMKWEEPVNSLGWLPWRMIGPFLSCPRIGISVQRLICKILTKVELHSFFLFQLPPISPKPLATKIAYAPPSHLLGWTNRAVEIRNLKSGELEGIFRHKRASKVSLSS